MDLIILVTRVEDVANTLAAFSANIFGFWTRFWFVTHQKEYLNLILEAQQTFIQHEFSNNSEQQLRKLTKLVHLCCILGFLPLVPLSKYSLS